MWDMIVGESLAIVDAACEAHPGVREVWACFSGGNDSQAASEIASRHPLFAGCFHVNTGITVPETNQFVRDYCKERGWPLVEKSPPSKDYDQIVLENGFPGPPSHPYMYSWLKERAIRQMTAERKAAVGGGRGDRIAFVTGIRSSESSRRMRTTQSLPYDREGARVWVAPMIGWCSGMPRDFLNHLGLRTNPVSDILGMSGECLCGAYASPGEFDRIARHFPHVAKRIEDLEDRAMEAGVHADWESRPNTPYSKLSARAAKRQMFCTTCEFRRDRDSLLRSEQAPTENKG